MPRSALTPPVLEVSEPHTVEMHQPHPTEPTCSRTQGPDTSYGGHLTPQHTPQPRQQAHAAMHTRAPTMLARGSAHLQLQDQVHAVLAEGADVVEDEGRDDVDPIGLVGHDAALGGEMQSVIPQMLPVLPAPSNTSQVQNGALPTALTLPNSPRSPTSSVSLERAPFAPQI